MCNKVINYFSTIPHQKATERRFTTALGTPETNSVKTTNPNLNKQLQKYENQ